MICLNPTVGAVRCSCAQEGRWKSLPVPSSDVAHRSLLPSVSRPVACYTGWREPVRRVDPRWSWRQSGPMNATATMPMGGNAYGTRRQPGRRTPPEGARGAMGEVVAVPSPDIRCLPADAGSAVSRGHRWFCWRRLTGEGMTIAAGCFGASGTDIGDLPLRRREGRDVAGSDRELASGIR